LSRVQHLYQLQLLDSELDQANHQLAQVTAALGESEALQQARAAVDAAKKELLAARTILKDLDLEVTGLATKISQQEKLLYGGQKMSPKEAANLQDEVASLKRWQEKREEVLLEAMVAAEEAEAALEQAAANLSTTQTQWSAGQEDLSRQKAVLAEQVAELTARRPALVERTDPADLNEYDRLRKKRAGRAVAAVKNGTCQGCGVGASQRKVQEARAGAVLVYCGTCGRILYVP
jgi:predicted  nucleic acid-binding Zn-ribbon protein